MSVVDVNTDIGDAGSNTVPTHFHRPPLLCSTCPNASRNAFTHGI